MTDVAKVFIDRIYREAGQRGLDTWDILGGMIESGRWEHKPEKRKKFREQRRKDTRRWLDAELQILPNGIRSIVKGEAMKDYYYYAGKEE